MVALSLSQFGVVAASLLSDATLSNCSSALRMTSDPPLRGPIKRVCPFFFWRSIMHSSRYETFPCHYQSCCEKHKHQSNVFIPFFFFFWAALRFHHRSLKSYKPPGSGKQTLRNILNVVEGNICIAVPASVPLPAAKKRLKTMEECTSVSHILTVVEWWTGWLKGQFPVEPMCGLTSCCSWSVFTEQSSSHICCLVLVFFF